MTGRDFPECFWWGAATSAHQVEGGDDGNDWWEFEQAGKVAGRDVSGDACDHFHRYEDDFGMAASLGHNAHRMSVSWSRIEPAEGVFDEGALAHYGRVVRALRERGIAPFVTLHHFTNPLWFARSGGWERRDAPEVFARFAERVAERLGAHVEGWFTLNEPESYVHLGYRAAFWPPEKRSWRAAHRVSTNLVRGHRAARAALKRVTPQAPVGMTIAAVGLCPPDGLAEHLLHPWFRYFAVDWFLDRCRSSLDLVGLQYYTRFPVLDLLPWRTPPHRRYARDPSRTDMGFEVYPRGLYEVSMRAWKRHGLPVVVTENGIADADDHLREPFIRDHLRELSRAIAEGADVRGYFHWSLLDNFEWREGYSKRFGLVEVDFATQERRVRPSARYYASVCRSGRIDVEPQAAGVRRPQPSAETTSSAPSTSASRSSASSIPTDNRTSP